MDNFINKIIIGNSISPPESCLQTFRENFRDAINAEWFSNKEMFEAIFYQYGFEYIAIFDLYGNLIEYRKYLPKALLPAEIKSSLEKDGQIMNALIKNKGNAIEYEVIVRDKSMKRFIILLSDSGTVIQRKPI